MHDLDTTDIIYDGLYTLETATQKLSKQGDDVHISGNWKKIKKSTKQKIGFPLDRQISLSALRKRMPPRNFQIPLQNAQVLNCNDTQIQKYKNKVKSKV
jgi:hypothetical protein